MNYVLFAMLCKHRTIEFRRLLCVCGLNCSGPTLLNESRPIHHQREVFIKLINQVLYEYNANNIIHKATFVMVLCRHLL